MALADFASDPSLPVANPIAAAFAAAARAVVAWRAERARHIALTELLAMDSHRLSDLGISAHDIQKALEGR